MALEIDTIAAARPALGTIRDGADKIAAVLKNIEDKLKEGAQPTDADTATLANEIKAVYAAIGRIDDLIGR